MVGFKIDELSPEEVNLDPRNLARPYDGGYTH